MLDKYWQGLQDLNLRGHTPMDLESIPFNHAPASPYIGVLGGTRIRNILHGKEVL